MQNWTRKQFLKASLAGAGATALSRHPLAAAVAAPGSANGDIRVAVVGLNSQGAGHMRTYFDLPGTRLVALCDVDSAVLDRRVKDCAERNIKVATYRDYRKLLENPDIDAVVIATPNHHHSLQAIWGLQAGKDVYVEKPLSHNIWEGRQAVRAGERYTKNILYAGTQNRSSLDIRNAIAQVRSGKFGRIHWARGLCYKRRESIGSTTGPQRVVPATVDYDLWTGPADLVPPQRNTPVNGPIHYDWHWFWNYGGGDIVNQGIHQMDVARWLLGETGLPPAVFSFGGRFGYDDDAETPNTLVSVFAYEKAPLIFEVRGLPMKAGMRAMDRYRAAQVGVVVQCEHAYVHVSENGTAVIYDNDHKMIENLTEGGNDRHRANFIQAVRDRKVVNAPALECHLSSVLCHLGNISFRLGAETTNPAKAGAFGGNEPAQEALGRVQEHLRANDVNPATTATVLGPLLRFDNAREEFTGGGELAARANGDALRKRAGRGAFKIPVV